MPRWFEAWLIGAVDVIHRFGSGLNGYVHFQGNTVDWCQTFRGVMAREKGGDGQPLKWTRLPHACLTG
jgi:hypothetical protein